MFKKIASVAIAAMMLGTTAAVAASAVETDGAVAAAEDAGSAVAAAEEGGSAVAAAEDGASTGSGNKIYFEVPGDWKNFKTITFFLSDHNAGEVINWGSKKGNMTDEGDGKWSFDLGEKGYDVGSGAFSCIFTADWGVQTCNLIIDAGNYNDTAYCTGNQVENDVNSNKKSYEVKWKSGHNGNPLTITSIGNIIGDTYWPGEDAYSVFYKFISTTDNKSIKNATKFNGKDEQTTIDETAKTLGLSKADVEKAVKEAKAAGADISWDASKSSLEGGSSGGDDKKEETTAASGGGSSTSGGSSSGGSSSSSSSGSSSSGGTTTSSSVTSGENDTIYFVIGGVMLAAIGVFFLARKKREY